MSLTPDFPDRIGALMTSDLIAIGPNDRVGRARDLMLSLGIHALPVMEDNVTIGIVTNTDLVDDWPEHEVVKTVMSKSPLAVDVEASLAEAAELMLAQRIHHLLVESEREVVGIVSSLDLLWCFASEFKG